MLSLVAGMVNVAGVLAISTLTTNVTGHFAYFAEEVARSQYQVAGTYLSYILSFLSGAFLCGLLVEMMIRKNPSRSHTLPLTLEIVLLLVVSVIYAKGIATPPWVARMLLFAMGLQNALVTQISKATVRTTHLTGLFTDLGIELSQLIYYTKKEQSSTLTRSIYLRVAIITCFFTGGLLAVFVFQELGIYVLFIAAAVLLVALVYDVMRIGFTYYRRKLTH